MFASVDRASSPFFSEPVFRLLGFTDSTLKIFEEIRSGHAVDPNSRRRVRVTLKRSITRLTNIIRVYARASRGFSAYYELRLL